MFSNRDVKNYLDRRFSRENHHLHSIRTQSQIEDLPSIQIPIHLGKLLYLLAKIQAPRKILEIGTLGGYSTTCLAQALPSDGQLISLELNPQHAVIAEKNLHIFKEGLIEIRVGHAIHLLAELAEAQEGPFDLIFIDADKEHYALYLEWALHLSRSGTLILIDNLIPKGEQIGIATNEEAQAIYAFNDHLAQHPQLEIAALPTLVGSEGRLDCLVIAYVKST